MKCHTTGCMPEFTCHLCCVRTHQKERGGSSDSFKLSGVEGASGKMNQNAVDRINYRHPAPHCGAIHEADIAYFDADRAQERHNITENVSKDLPGKTFKTFSACLKRCSHDNLLSGRRPRNLTPGRNGRALLLRNRSGGGCKANTQSGCKPHKCSKWVFTIKNKYVLQSPMCHDLQQPVFSVLLYHQSSSHNSKVINLRR